MEVGADGVRHSGGAAQVQTGVEGVVRLAGALQDLGAHHRPGTPCHRAGCRRGWRACPCPGVVVVQDGGGDDSGVGEVPLIQPQLIEAAHHAVGLHAPQLALLDLLAAGEGGVVQGHGHHIAGVDVPGAGDNLDGRALAHIQLADPHVVGIRVALHGEDGAHHDIEISAPRSSVVSTLEPERVMASAKSLSLASTCTNSSSHFLLSNISSITPLYRNAGVPRKSLAEFHAAGVKNIQSFSEGHVPAENSLTQPPWAAFTSDRCHW